MRRTAIDGRSHFDPYLAFEVLQANLEFYHFEAEEMRQLIRKLPADGLTDDQQAPPGCS